MKTVFLLLFLVQSVASTCQVINEEGVAVRVNSFTASQLGSVTHLQWSAVCFLQYANFVLERSTDGIHYTTIYQVRADKFRCQSPFDFEDKSSEGKVFYRLKAGDLDGIFSTSKVVAVHGLSKGFDITAMVPSLVNSASEVNISSASTDKVLIYATSLSGVTVLLKSVSLVKGGNTIPLNLSSLSKGTFVLSCRSSQGVKTTRFMKL